MGETLTGETVQFYQKLAKEKNVYLSLGGIHEVIVDQVRIEFNAIFFLFFFL